MTPENYSDDPVLRLQNGDKEAFRELVEAHQARIRLSIAACGMQPADVDDIAQDAFIYVYEHIHDFQAGTNFAAWCKAIARNKVLAFLEAKKREKRNKENALEFFLLEASGVSAEGPESEAILNRLQSCMTRLTGRISEVMKARYAGVPLEKLAAGINRSVAAVKMMLLRARVELRKCMEAQA